MFPRTSNGQKTVDMFLANLKTVGMFLETFFRELDGAVTEYDDSLVRRLIERITVYDDHFTVEFKSGIEVDVEL